MGLLSKFIRPGAGKFQPDFRGKTWQQPTSEIFAFSSYREFLRSKVGKNSARNGERIRMAQFIRVHPSFISQDLGERILFLCQMIPALQRRRSKSVPLPGQPEGQRLPKLYPNCRPKFINNFNRVMSRFLNTGFIPTQLGSCILLDMTQNMPLDQAIFTKLCEKDSSGRLIKNLGGIFISKVPLRIRAIRIAACTKDYNKIGTLAHQVKSCSGQMGAVDLTEICCKLEEFSSREQTNALWDLIDAMENEFSRVRAALESEMKRISI